MKSIWIALLATAGFVTSVALFAPEWSYNVLLSFDQHVNTIFGGDPDETISSRLGKWQERGDELRRFIANQICGVLDIVDPGHCRKSIDPTEGVQ